MLILGTAWGSFSTRSVAPTASWCVAPLTASPTQSDGPTPTHRVRSTCGVGLTMTLSTKPREDPEAVSYWSFAA